MQTNYFFTVALKFCICVVFVGGQTCPTITVVEEYSYYVKEPTKCNDQESLEFFVYEDCPTDVLLFQVDDGYFVDDVSCPLTVKIEGQYFGFVAVGDAESFSNEINCTNLFQSKTNSEDTHSAQFKFQDVNEFPPQPADGIELAQRVDVDENTSGVILSFGYEDLDAGEVESITCVYDFSGTDEEIFEIVSKGVNGQTMMFDLTANEALDYETNSFFNLEAVFQSYDSRGNSSSTNQAFLIVVQDLGDNPPFFIMSVPFTSIPEGAANRAVFQVEAQDRDVMINNKIMYSIISGDDGYFRIDEWSGEVFTAVDIDREMLESTLFSLEIQALEVVDDLGTPAPDNPTTSQTTSVNIEDINDNIPTFYNDSVISTTEEFNGNDPSSIKSLNIIIVVADMDEGPSGEYTLTTNNPNVLLNPTMGIGETSFSVNIQKSDDFDYEMQQDNPNILVEITATEQANPSHVSQLILTIVLTDINDNIPTFEQERYDTSLYEIAPPGTSVINITATDDDVSSEFNADNIIYSISGCSEFTIDSKTGEVSVAEPGIPNRVGNTNITCTLRVSDMNGSSPDSLESVAILTVLAIDVDVGPMNDNSNIKNPQMLMP